MRTYDRDGQVIPDDWYSQPRGQRPRMVTEQRVGRTQVGEFLVSTVWLMGIDHSFMSDVPILFETMVFGGQWDQELDRYATEEQAMRGHLRVVDRLRAGEPPFDDSTDPIRPPGAWRDLILDAPEGDSDGG